MDGFDLRAIDMGWEGSNDVCMHTVETKGMGEWGKGSLTEIALHTCDSV